MTSLRTRTGSARLLLPAALAVALLAGACGDDDDGDDAATATTGVATTEAAPATGAPPATDAAPTTEPVPETTTTAPPGPHVVEHAMGSTEVPGDPQRVVVLDSSFLDSAIAVLGLTPIAATEGIPGSGLPAYLGDSVADVELVGDTTTPNLELIASLRPDLIMGAKVRHEALYDQLSAIAPTVFSESSGTDWTAQVRLTGDALGRAEDADVLLAEFEARAVAVGEAIGAPGRTATIVRFIPGQNRLYGPATFSGSVLTLVGFDLGDRGYDPSFGMALISTEQVELVDADVIFATNPGVEAGQEIQTDRGTFEQLWQTLPAVQAGQVFDIEDGTWMTGIGVLGANRILDDLETWLG